MTNRHVLMNSHFEWTKKRGADQLVTLLDCLVRRLDVTSLRHNGRPVSGFAFGMTGLNGTCRRSKGKHGSPAPPGHALPSRTQWATFWTIILVFRAGDSMTCYGAGAAYGQGQNAGMGTRISQKMGLAFSMARNFQASARGPRADRQSARRLVRGRGQSRGGRYTTPAPYLPDVMSRTGISVPVGTVSPDVRPPPRAAPAGGFGPCHTS